MITVNTHRLRARDVARDIYRYTLLRKALLFISLCCVLLAVCAFRVASLPVILTSADNGKIVKVSAGNQVIIQLPENTGSTGYRWNFTTSKNQVLTWQKAAYLPSTSHPMLGAAGTIVFTFQAHDSGSVNLQFALQRSWETNVPPVQRFAVTILVRH